jgi:cytochrome P450
MIALPEVECQTQAALDVIVGRARFGTFTDAPHLPYVRAITKEILRWRPAVPFGLPHKATEDDLYGECSFRKARHVWPIFGNPIMMAVLH